MVEEVDVEGGGGVVPGVITGMVARDIVEVEGIGPSLRVVAGLGKDGVRVVWWKGLLVVVVLEKVKEMVEIWWCFGVCGGINGDGGGRR